MTTRDIVIAADFGTTSVKVAAIGEGFRILHRAVAEYPLHTGPGGVVEQNPDDWWQAFRLALQELAGQMPGLAERVGCLTFVCQLLGVICADENGRPLRPCLTWLDKRAADVARRKAGGFPSVGGYNVFKLARWMHLSNGAPLLNGMDPYAKFAWLMENEPEVFARTRWLLDVKDWLIMKATGCVTTSAENANVTWLWDGRPGRESWSPALLRAAGIPAHMMPTVRDGCDEIGGLTAEAAADLGLRRDVVVLGGVSDVTAAALGAGEVDDGALHICCSTSCWLAGFFPGRRLSIGHGYATLTSALGYRPILMVSQENGASTVDWATRVLQAEGGAGTGSATEFFADIGTPQSDDPFFLPWLAGETVPLNDARVRGGFHGLSLHHDVKALKRAVLEGVALNLRWAYQIASREKGVVRGGPIRLVGGLADNAHFVQWVADALERPVALGETRHAGVLGASALAARTMGWSADVWSAAAAIKRLPHRIVEPDAQRAATVAERAERLERKRRHLIRAYR